MSEEAEALNKQAWAIVTRVLLFLSLVISCLIAWGMPFPNEDLFLGFCSGRATLSGHLAAPDKWAFTLEGRVWVDQSWLSHLIYYVSFLNFAYFGPVLIKGLLLASCAVILYLTCRALDASPEISMLSVTLGILSLAPFLKIRGENFGMLLFVLLAAVLSSPASWGRWRQFGSLAILAVWANCHGSFMLGFFLIGLRFSVDVVYAVRHMVLSRLVTRRAEKPLVQEEIGETGLEECLKAEERFSFPDASHDVPGWAVTILLAVGVMAFVNPYGPENLIIPFNQIGEKTVTAEWVDWRPLIHAETLFNRGLFKPVSVLPFLSLLTIAVGLLVFLVATAGGIRNSLILLLGRTGRIDTLTVVLIPVLLAPLVYRFQRMIVFAAPAMVPLIALLINACGRAWAERYPRSNDSLEDSGKKAIFAVLACMSLVMVSFVFYKSVLIRHLPGNPLTYQELDPPLLSGLMSRNFMRADVVRFLNENHIKGRVFTNVYLSNYLLFHVPHIQVFFDLRVQSVFPERVVKDYLSLVTPGSHDFEETVSLLKRNRIDLVILDTSKSVNTWLADRLMETKTWGCIYADEWVIVLAAATSARFGPMISAGNLDGLLYDRPETKTLALGLLSLFTQGNVDSDILTKLITRVKEHPRPEVYSVIMGAMNGPSPCLNSRTRAFLESEAARLAKSDYLVTGGAFTILRSLLKILVILETNEIRCVPNGNPRKFTKQRWAFTAAFDEVREQYGGF